MEENKINLVDKQTNQYTTQFKLVRKIITRIQQVKLYEILSIFLFPLIVGFFLFKKYRNEHLSLEKELIYEIRNELLSIMDGYNTILEKDTYLIFGDKIEFKHTLYEFEEYVNFLDKNKNHFQNNIESLIKKCYSTIYSLDHQIGKYNAEFLKKRKQKYDYLFKKSPFEVDDNQKNAVIVDDTHNLVVAGAGSGKTEVIVNRIAYLIEREPDTINPKRILALAFQRDASNEMKERLKQRYGHDVEIRTFHSLGLDILKKAGERSNMFGGDNHDREQSKLLHKLIEDEKKSSDFQNSLINYMKFVGTEDKIKKEVDFNTKKAFYEYQRGLQYTSLDGRKVKSIGELTILNFFLSHKINDEDITVLYESYADWMEYIDKAGRKQTPTPDFYVPYYDVYIEHWSTDKNGDVPDRYDKDKYINTMEIKKKKFIENDKTLVQTTFGEFVNNPDFEKLLEERLIEALSKKFPEEEFIITPIPYYELVEKVWDECKTHIKALPKNISSFIRNAKTYRLAPEVIRNRLKEKQWSSKQIAFANVALKIFEDYEEVLHSSGKIDFEDMINLAVDTLKKYDDLDHDIYDHILIDEYQDISKQRYELIKTLMDKNPNCKLFCVGDDWQSIMGFAGSNPEFFVHFGKYFNHPAITHLTYNYRSISSIVETGNDIIKQNEGLQIDKKVESLINDDRPIKVYALLHRKSYKKQYFQQVAEHCIHTVNELLSNGYSNRDIMVLTRIYNNPLFNEYFQDFAKKKRIRYSSVHRSKGQQAKIVIILNVDDGLYGFPCEIQSPTILEPARIDNNLGKEVEERRLFYVAVTRAMEDVIIYSQHCSRSKFIDEISDHIEVEKLTY